jgi:hypothetical protein
VFAVVPLRSRDVQTLLRLGAIMLAIGVGIVVVSLSMRSLLAFMVGTAVTGREVCCHFSSWSRAWRWGSLPLPLARDLQPPATSWELRANSVLPSWFWQPQRCWRSASEPD